VQRPATARLVMLISWAFYSTGQRRHDLDSEQFSSAQRKQLKAMVALMGVAGPPRSLSKGKSIMKLALTGIASVGILAVTVGVETTNAQSYRRYGPARTYTPQPYPPQSRLVPRAGVPRTVPFSDPNSPEATGGGNIGYNRGLPDGGY
jgi:hypothetical protein